MSLEGYTQACESLFISDDIEDYLTTYTGHPRIWLVPSRSAHRV
jgi:hypothetical protein